MITELPPLALLGSYHLLEVDGAPAIGRVDHNGWTIFWLNLSISREMAVDMGFKHVRLLDIPSGLS